jgi:LmbE family N-acetylglucosaminyl deacetylase
MVAVSPHCDDAVFGCGELIAAHPGAVVVTVFAGRPLAYRGVTRWDAAAGFTDRDDPVARRREEDREALAAVGAAPVWLDFRDAQYAPSPAVAEIWPALEHAIIAQAPDTVAIPVGLFHSDHHLARDASLEVLRRHAHFRWLAYEDAIYRGFPRLAREALERLRARKLTLTPVDGADRRHLPAKRDAVGCYRSQLRALAAPGHPGVDTILEAERCWRVRV